MKDFEHIIGICTKGLNRPIIKHYTFYLFFNNEILNYKNNNFHHKKYFFFKFLLNVFDKDIIYSIVCTVHLFFL